MAWETPKTDWEDAEGVTGSDFNKIEGNILELYNRMQSYFVVAGSLGRTGVLLDIGIGLDRYYFASFVYTVPANKVLYLVNGNVNFSKYEDSGLTTPSSRSVTFRIYNNATSLYYTSGSIAPGVLYNNASNGSPVGLNLIFSMEISSGAAVYFGPTSCWFLGLENRSA